MQYLSAFIVGGIICAIGQIFIDKTKLTPARILVLFEVAGVFLTAVGLYQPLKKIGGAGATVPITGFGYSLVDGVMKEVDRIGIMGALTGGFTATSAGLGAAIFFALIMALIFRPKAKK